MNKGDAVVHATLGLVALLYFLPRYTATTLISGWGYWENISATGFFPYNFLWVSAYLSLLGVPLYYSYLVMDILGLYLSLLGSYVFVRDVVEMALGLREGLGPLTKMAILFSSMLVVFNPFIANNYDLGLSFLPFLTLSLAASAEAIKHRFSDWRYYSLIFLLGFLLIYAYRGYTLVPFFYLEVYVMLVLPASWGK
ncbi:MAG: hypothetical protein ACP5IE_06960, partial [Infirmifilum sp.]